MEDMIFAGAMLPRNKPTSRLLKQFHNIYLEPFLNSSLIHIFSHIIGKELTSRGLPSEIINFKINLVKGIV